MTVSSVGRHLAICVAEWQKANSIMNCSTYAEKVTISNRTVFFGFNRSSSRGTDVGSICIPLLSYLPFNVSYCTFTECKSKTREHR